MITKTQQLEQRIELLEQRLVDLAARCWPQCGTEFASELAEEIRKASENTKQHPAAGG